MQPVLPSRQSQSVEALRNSLAGSNTRRGVLPLSTTALAAASAVASIAAPSCAAWCDRSVRRLPVDTSGKFSAFGDASPQRTSVSSSEVEQSFVIPSDGGSWAGNATVASLGMTTGGRGGRGAPGSANSREGRSGVDRDPLTKFAAQREGSGAIEAKFGIPAGALGIPAGALGIPAGALGIPAGALGIPPGVLHDSEVREDPRVAAINSGIMGINGRATGRAARAAKAAAVWAARAGAREGLAGACSRGMAKGSGGVGSGACAAPGRGALTGGTLSGKVVLEGGRSESLLRSLSAFIRATSCAESMWGGGAPTHKLSRGDDRICVGSHAIGAASRTSQRNATRSASSHSSRAISSACTE
eukprot:395016-Prymnesium_polylepis.1